MTLLATTSPTHTQVLPFPSAPASLGKKKGERSILITSVVCIEGSQDEIFQ